MVDIISVPRRSYDFEDYVDILRRNLRWLIGPAFAGVVIATVIAYSKQDTYISSASIRVVPQQVSTEVVKPLTTQDMADRINGMAQEILSRNALTSIINSWWLLTMASIWSRSLRMSMASMSATSSIGTTASAPSGDYCWPRGWHSPSSAR